MTTTTEPGARDQAYNIWGKGPTLRQIPEDWASLAPDNCTAVVGVSDGRSDYGQVDHVCTACAEGCGLRNMQSPVYARYTIEPPLEEVNAFELLMVVAWKSIIKVQPHPSSGVYSKMKFRIAHTDGKGFDGQMGPVVRGGGVEGGALSGKHVFEIEDTEHPAPFGGIVEGRRLALASRPQPGDVGFCSRVCTGCQTQPRLLSIGETTGVRCEVNMAMYDGDGFVYRLALVSGEAAAEFEDAVYRGAEWLVVLRSLSTGNEVPVGRIVLEGNTHANGIERFSILHTHLGCTPCDAFYQSAVVSGPFIVRPHKRHRVTTCDVAALESVGTECNLRRAVGLGGQSVLLESGPGVWPTLAQNNTIYSCK